jgi:hypothetical protein
LIKAVLLNEYHFKKVFTFGGVPFCVLPEEFLNSKNLVRKYVGDIYRDLSTSCSIRNEGGDVGVAQVEDRRSRFNWQDRKRYDLKRHLAACEQCALTETCEGVWRGYLDIYGGGEISTLSLEQGRIVRRLPLVSAPPSANSNVSKSPFPVRLTVMNDV